MPTMTKENNILYVQEELLELASVVGGCKEAGKCNLSLNLNAIARPKDPK